MFFVDLAIRAGYPKVPTRLLYPATILGYYTHLLSTRLLSDVYNPTTIKRYHLINSILFQKTISVLPDPDLSYRLQTTTGLRLTTTDGFPSGNYSDRTTMDSSSDSSFNYKLLILKMEVPFKSGSKDRKSDISDCFPCF